MVNILFNIFFFVNNIKKNIKVLKILSDLSQIIDAQTILVEMGIL